MAEYVKILLRLDRELWEQMKQWAVDEDRTLTAQIVHILRRALKEWR